MVKGVTRSRHVRTERDERKRTSELTHRNASDVIETGIHDWPGTSMEGTYLLIMRWPVHRRRDFSSGFRMELENLISDVNGNGTSGGPARPKVRRRWPGADCSVVVTKWM
jgi:hypothetical protein